AAPRETDFKEGPPAQSERRGHTNAGLQSLKPEIVRLSAHLAKLTKYPYPERIHDLPLVADLVRHEIAVTEAIVRIAPQQVLVVNVGAAKSRLKIERDTVPAIRLTENEPADEMDRAEALISIQREACDPSRVEPSKRERPSVERFVVAIGH